jgi:serine/threonine-protein kinase
MLAEAGGAGNDAAPPSQPVVLKVMHPHLFEHEQVRGRFVREAAILRRLNGPFLCPVLDAGETDDACGVAGLPFLVLPFIDGRALDETLQRDGLPVPTEAASLVRDVCLALAHAHERGVFHRDLKPANILVDGAFRPTVIDFGLAKILGFGSGTTNLTQSGMLFGTPEYMAPEQVRGEEVDARSDVWAAGCVLYEVLTGHRPFAARTPVATMNAILAEPLATPRDRAPARNLPPAVDAVACHALAKAPEARYPTAALMAEALIQALAAPEDAASVAPDRLLARAELGHAPTDLDLRAPRAAAIDRLGSSGTVSSRALPASTPAPPSRLRSFALGAVVVLVAVAAIAAGVALALH